MSSKEYQELVSIAGAIKHGYLNKPNPWSSSPFGWVRQLPTPAETGSAGACLVSKFLRNSGFSVVSVDGTDADVKINNRHVEIKFATLSARNTFIFNQLRDQEYHIVLCFGVFPDDAYAWVASKGDINGGVFPTRKEDKVSDKVHSFTPQHGGEKKGNANTCMLTLKKPPSAPPWMRPQNGDLSDMLRELKKLTGN